ncbi:hypothetical protein J2T55_002094 [Methylohalomonas lacus]|uniref:Uncharacterized protein n=1 Tax=Methylohalomonas lacus TaxID=398773 RepID=A0AAE3L275_9GAMM|nr:hypothetical protein [Methylohalomonas lacus]MCS3904061.1 hypothetical protein [Methylohalomonas lacus]
MTGKPVLAALALWFASMPLAAEIVPIERSVAFGLGWGMTSEALATDGVELQDPVAQHDSVRVYRLWSLPGDLGDGESYRLWLTPDNGLQGIKVTGQVVANDRTGEKIRQRYDELKAILAERFGSADKTAEYSGREKYTEYYEFNKCLAHDGCGRWSSYFSDHETRVLLRLRAVDRDSSHYELIYAGPHWQADWLEEADDWLSAD